MDKSYRVILSSGYSAEIDARYLEALVAAIKDEAERFEPYLVNEDGPYIVPAHVVAIEIVHGGEASAAMSSAEAVAVASATLEVPELSS